QARFNQTARGFGVSGVRFWGSVPSTLDPPPSTRPARLELPHESTVTPPGTTMDTPTSIDTELPAHARIVIVGAGIVGVSAAWELTKRGVSNVVVIDRGDLFRTGGSTSHAPGGVFQNNSVRTVSK